MINRKCYIDKIRPFIGTDLIKVITGIRRSGKSVMLELIKNELRKDGVSDNSMISCNFEELRNSHLCNYEKLHSEIVSRISRINGKSYLFFDEIQEVKDWERCVNSLRVSCDCDIYVTGSNAKLLSGELATHLAGRYVEFVVYPFSFSEFYELYSEINRDALVQGAFKSYLLLGGMPYLCNLRYAEAPSKQYLADIYNSVQLKDVIKRNNIRDVDLLERILLYILANIGTTFSSISISKFLKSERRTASPDTILNYLSYCADAYLIHKVKREDLQGKQILSTHEKYYVADHGIREMLFGTNQKDINLVLENIVYMELLRRDYRITVGKLNDKEIDFVCLKNGEKIYIQVAYLLADDAVIQREFGVFDKVKDHYPKYVISMDEFDMSRDGVRHLNMIDWLMQPL